MSYRFDISYQNLTVRSKAYSKRAFGSEPIHSVKTRNKRRADLIMRSSSLSLKKTNRYF